MQLKPDGLLPIGGAVSGLDNGPGQALREASPQGHRHFTHYKKGVA